MPAREPPTAQDAATARQILLDGLAHDVDVFEILNRLAPLHPRNNTFPAEVFLRMAAEALDWAGVDRNHPVALAVMRERFLPECSVIGRDRRKLQFAVLATAAQHGGVDVDLLDEIAWWQSDDFWRYAAWARSPTSAWSPPVPTCPCQRSAAASLRSKPRRGDERGEPR